MSNNLVVQPWGIGNLIQTEPLMRYLGAGDILVNPVRSTHEMAPLFPKWNFLGVQFLDGRMMISGTAHAPYDDVYLCGPWIPPANFSGVAKRVHSPTWTFQGAWVNAEWMELLDMVQRDEDSIYSPPRLPRLDGWPKPFSRPYVVVSCGYNRHEGDAWKFKDWGVENWKRLFSMLFRNDVKSVLVGSSSEWGELGRESHRMWATQNSMIEQIKFASGCVGYIGNDTGWAHICGAYGLPSAVYVADPARQDPVKNRTAAPDLFQFGPDVPPEQVVRWLLPKLKEKGHAWEEETSLEGQG